MIAKAPSHRAIVRRAVDLGDGFVRAIVEYTDQPWIGIAKIRAGGAAIHPDTIEVVYGVDEAINLAVQILAGDPAAAKRPALARILASCVIVLAERRVVELEAARQSKVPTEKAENGKAT